MMALPAELHERWESTFGVELIEGIGSSEAYHMYITNRPGNRRIGTVGTPVPGYRARVVDASGAELTDGETGRLDVIGKTAALEYLKEPAKTSATFSGDTIHTEDLFVRHPDGTFSYRGRVGDFITIDGTQIFPLDIEECIARHPDVTECAVTSSGQPERLAAYVVATGDGDVLVQSLIEHIDANLGGHQRPQQLHLVPVLPKTPNGKIDRAALRESDAGPPTI